MKNLSRVVGAGCFILFGLAVSTVMAADPKAPPTKPGAGVSGATPPNAVTGPADKVVSRVDRECGEEDLIRRRHEWFYGQREEGSEGRMRALRLQGVARAKEMLEAQRESGREEAVNALSCRGPSSSNFGGWGFGRVSGRIPALAKDWTNNILYAGGASGGLWKSSDDGASWMPLLDSAGSLAVGAVAVDPNTATTIWAGTGENSMDCESYFGIGILRSTDGGATWQARNGSGASTLENLSAFGDILVAPGNSNRVVVGGRYRDCVNGNMSAGGIYTTDDAGATWTNRLVGGVTRVTRDPGNALTFWAGVEGDGVYRSTDGGNTWNRLLAATGRIDVSVSPADSAYVYVLASGGGRVFSRTTNGTAATPTWTTMSSGASACDGQCGYNMTVRADLTDRDKVYRGNIRLYRSINGGAAWTDLVGGWGNAQKVHQDIHTLAMDPSNATIFYVGCDGGIWKTTDGGANFTNLNSNLNLTQFYAVGNHPSDDDILVGGCQDNSSLARTGLTGDVWNVQNVTGDGFRCHIKASDPNLVYITSYPCNETDCGAGIGAVVPTVLRSTTGVFGAFSQITTTGAGLAGNEPANWVTPYILSPTNPGTMFLGTSRVYRSTNDGTNWTAISADLTGGSGDIYSIEVNRNSGGRLWAGTTSGRVWTSADGNAAAPTWTDVSGGLPGRQVNMVAGDPADATRAFCVVGGFGAAHLYEYNGTTWMARPGGLPNVPTTCVFMMNANEIYVGNDVGLFKSSDRGLSFVPFMNGLPQGLVVTDLKYTAATNTLTVGTYGRGAWQITLACSLTCTASGPAISQVGAPAAFTAGNTPAGCMGAPSYSWTFGDGGTSAAQNPSHTYAATGDFTWVMTVTVDGIPCSQTGTVRVCGLTCSATVPAYATAGAPVSFASSAILTGPCPGPITYAWTFGDGGVDATQNPTHTYAAVGDYNWTLTVTANGLTCAQSGTVAVCSLDCTATVPATGVVAFPVSFASTATMAGSCPGPVTYAWDFGDGSTAATQNASHTYAVGGTFTWTLTVTANGLSCSQTGTIQICPYNISLADDAGRSSLCFNTVTGDWQWMVWRGPVLGTFTGAGKVSLAGGVYSLISLPGVPVTVSAKYQATYKKGSGSFSNRPLRINSALLDTNTANNPPCCP